MKTINIGVVGLGYWGPNLLRNFLNTPGCRVKYGCDLRQEALNKLKLQHPTVKFTNRYGDILNGKDVDAVVIATPVSTHFELAKSALLANKHVLLEKPMASSAKECEELIEIAGKRNLILMMDYTFLYTGAIRKIKEIIDSKELGKIIYFDSERINLGLIQDDINVIWDLAPHDISIMNYIFEEIKPISIFAIGTNHINKNFEEMAHITIKFDSGAVGHIHVSWLSPVKIRKILIGGTKKMILYDDVEPSEKVKVYDKEIFLDLAQETPQKPIYRSGDVHTPKLEEMEALKLEVEHFIRCVNKEEVPLVDGRAGLGVVKILEACDKSLKEKKEIIL